MVHHEENYTRLMSTIRQPFPTVPRLYGAVMMLTLLATPLFADQAIVPFWTPTIKRALNQRDIYYKMILPDTTNYSLLSLSDAQRIELCDRLASQPPDTCNPWYHFVRGILECGEGKSPALNHFTTVIALTQTDPGATWTLFVEFTRNNQGVWAERCLMQLEKLLFSSGARAAPVIAQQLLFYASASERQKEYSVASNYYAWADRFDPNQAWSLLHRFRNSLPFHPQLFPSSLSAGMKTVRNSWSLQLALAANGYAWLNYFLWVVLLVVFAGLSFRHLPKAFHSVSDRLPETLPPLLKTLLSMAVALSLLSFGYIPFLWFIAFYIWAFLEKKEKAIITLALALLVCTPLLSRIEDMFVQARLPHGSLSLYLRASEEGYSPEIHQLVLDRVLLDRSDALAQLAASVCAIKKGDTAAARMHATNAIALRPEDPVILTTAGNAAYSANNWDSAAGYYQKVLVKYPKDIYARFNLAQCFARISGKATDLEFSKLLAPDELARINDFSAINNLYFSSNWPLLRQVFAPTYRPRYFWMSVFPLSNGSWKSTKILWGASFFGIPPFGSFLIFLALFILLLSLGATSAARKRKQRIFSCRLCDRALCNRCKEEDLCHSCHQGTRYIRNVKILAAVQSKIKRTRRRMLDCVEHAFDISAPGVGMLFARRYSFRRIIPLILLTGILYASFLFLSNARFDYPHWVTYGVAGRMPYLLLVYNGIFVIRAALTIFRKKGATLT